jgi:hypothetical protein
MDARFVAEIAILSNAFNSHFCIGKVFVFREQTQAKKSLHRNDFFFQKRDISQKKGHPRPENQTQMPLPLIMKPSSLVYSSAPALPDCPTISESHQCGRGTGHQALQPGAGHFLASDPPRSGKPSGFPSGQTQSETHRVGSRSPRA